MLLSMSNGVVEYVNPYTSVGATTNGIGEFEFTVGQQAMEPPIYVYYQLDEFHQNHRRYVQSRSDPQMRDTSQVVTDPRELHTCKPWCSAQGCSSAGTPFYPCGLVARSIFNDTFVVRKQASAGGAWDRVVVDSSPEQISWPADREGAKSLTNLIPTDRHESGAAYEAVLDMWLN